MVVGVARVLKDGVLKINLRALLARKLGGNVRYRMQCERFLSAQYDTDSLFRITIFDSDKKSEKTQESEVVELKIQQVRVVTARASMFLDFSTDL